MFFLSIKKVDQKQFSPKKICWLKKMLTQNSFGPKPFFEPKNFLFQNNLGPENFGSKQFLGQKNLDQKTLGSKKFRSTNSRPPKNYLVKIGSVTAETFLIWTNVTRTNVAWTNVSVTVGIFSRWSQEPTYKVWSKSCQWQLRYSWYGQMSQGQMLPEQMSLWHLEYVKKGPRNLHLKFGHNRASKSWYIADMDKCRLDKCCMDKCPFDNCLRLFRVIV